MGDLQVEFIYLLVKCRAPSSPETTLTFKEVFSALAGFAQ